MLWLQSTTELASSRIQHPTLFSITSCILFFLVFKYDQLLSYLYKLAVSHANLLNLCVVRRPNEILHLHRLDADQWVAFFHFLSDAYEDFDHCSGHWWLDKIRLSEYILPTFFLTNRRLILNVLFQLLSFWIQKYNPVALVAVYTGAGVIFRLDQVTHLKLTVFALEY